MTLVNKITEDIEYMPLAAFIFKEREGDDLHISNISRLKVHKELQINPLFVET